LIEITSYKYTSNADSSVAKEIGVRHIHNDTLFYRWYWPLYWCVGWVYR